MKNREYAHAGGTASGRFNESKHPQPSSSIPFLASSPPEAFDARVLEDHASEKGVRHGTYRVLVSLSKPFGFQEPR